MCRAFKIKRRRSNLGNLGNLGLRDCNGTGWEWEYSPSPYLAPSYIYPIHIHSPCSMRNFPHPPIPHPCPPLQPFPYRDLSRPQNCHNKLPLLLLQHNTTISALLSPNKLNGSMTVSQWLDSMVFRSQFVRQWHDDGLAPVANLAWNATGSLLLHR